mmetsp:Transcript_125219/g.359626  ORF Transcript_125219/g.359626 Transcript_125219/m.359626 type:complete len:210 (-) Transcript_125219:572-1201(-)
MPHKPFPIKPQLHLLRRGESDARGREVRLQNTMEQRHLLQLASARFERQVAAAKDGAAERHGGEDNWRPHVQDPRVHGGAAQDDACDVHAELPVEPDQRLGCVEDPRANALEQGLLGGHIELVASRPQDAALEPRDLPRRHRRLDPPPDAYTMAVDLGCQAKANKHDPTRIFTLRQPLGCREEAICEPDGLEHCAPRDDVQPRHPHDVA